MKLNFGEDKETCATLLVMCQLHRRPSDVTSLGSLNVFFLIVSRTLNGEMRKETCSKQRSCYAIN